MAPLSDFNMKHTEEYRLRWHDTDAGLSLRPSALLVLMQETSNLQFVCRGKSLDDIRREQGVGFILSRIAFDVLRLPTAYEKLRVETFTCPAHGFTYPRGFEVFAGEELVARCHSLWALVRVADKTLVKAADFPLTFGDEQPLLTDTPIRFRIPLEAELYPVGERRIVYSDLDYNMHMNNTKYPDMLCDFLPSYDELAVTGMALAYHREAAFEDVITVERAAAPDGVYYFRTKREGEICLEAMVRTAKRN